MVATDYGPSQGFCESSGLLVTPVQLLRTVKGCPSMSQSCDPNLWLSFILQSRLAWDFFYRRSWVAEELHSRRVVRFEWGSGGRSTSEAENARLSLLPSWVTHHRIRDNSAQNPRFLGCRSSAKRTKKIMKWRGKKKNIKTELRNGAKAVKVAPGVVLVAATVLISSLLLQWALAWIWRKRRKLVIK